MINKPPFFIVGCVRSGTTMLRNVLKLHPNLYCPEETHFFRWAQPFGTENYYDTFLNSKLFKEHRILDNISEHEFIKLLNSSTSKADLQRRYCKLFLQKNKPTATRWFDKTPQNIYGLLLLIRSFPSAKFVHIVRNPTDVVASLKIGKVVKVSNLIGAINYWNEAIDIIQEAKPCFKPKSFIELNYEDFTKSPHQHLELLMNFLGEDYNENYFSKFVFKESSHDDDQTLSQEETDFVLHHTKNNRGVYGY